MIADGDSPDSSSGLDCFDVQLAFPGETMTDQGPVYQVGAMIDRSSGEVLESRGGAEVIFANSDDGRVGIEARDDWILDRSHD